MTNAFAVDTARIQNWLKLNQAPDVVEQELALQGLHPEAISAHLLEYKKALYSRRQMKGFICMALGAFLGFVSCVLTMVNPIPSLYDLILYGVTSLAVTIVFVGLYLVFE